MLGGHTYGSFANTFTGDYGASDFFAIAIDGDGNELWRWQVSGAMCHLFVSKDREDRKFYRS